MLKRRILIRWKDAQQVMESLRLDTYFFRYSRHHRMNNTFMKIWNARICAEPTALKWLRNIVADWNPPLQDSPSLMALKLLCNIVADWNPPLQDDPSLTALKLLRNIVANWNPPLQHGPSLMALRSVPLGSIYLKMITYRFSPDSSNRSRK